MTNFVEVLVVVDLPSSVAIWEKLFLSSRRASIRIRSERVKCFIKNLQSASGVGSDRSIIRHCKSKCHPYFAGLTAIEGIFVIKNLHLLFQ